MSKYYKKKKKEWLFVIIALLLIGCIYLFVILTLSPIKVWDVVLVIILIFPIVLVESIIMLAIGKYMNYSKGQKGEDQTYEELADIKPCALYRNVVLPGEVGDVDLIVVSRKGIFAVEIKKWEGKLEANGSVWYQTLKGESRNRMNKSFSNQAISNQIKLLNYLKSKLDESIGNKLFIKPLLVLLNPFDEKDINTNVAVISLEKLKETIVSEDFQTDKNILNAVKRELDKLNSFES